MNNEALLLRKLNLQYPIIAIYDAPSKDLFSDVIEPKQGTRVCMFAYFNQWKDGKTLCLQENNSGCKGCGYWWFGKETRSKEDFVKFLVDDEGLKDTKEHMNEWVMENNSYCPENNYVFIGPYNEKLNSYVKTITFWVNADQLSVLSIAAFYFSKTNGVPPVMMPFGSGCMQALTLFDDFESPRAIVGSLDLAMRKYLPKEIFAFTVTLPMYELFMKIDSKSFLDKPFLSSLVQARGGKL